MVYGEEKIWKGERRGVVCLGKEHTSRRRCRFQIVSSEMDGLVTSFNQFSSLSGSSLLKGSSRRLMWSAIA